ncbi:MAG: TldD/PmbA family protein [Lachnospiraceae bacterium]|nr:TldD/PmbA family protein [Lachnospiraceae bacterium]
MLQDILQSKTGLFETGVSTELRAHENRQRRVVLVAGNLMGNVRTETSGISARVCKNGVYGFASAGSYTSEMADNVLKAATRNAIFMDRHVGKKGTPLPVQNPGYVELRRVIVDTEQKKLIELCKEVDAYVAAHCPKLASRTVVYTEDSMDKILYTSDAKNGHITSPRAYIYVMMNAMTPAGTPVELFKAFGGAGSCADNFADLTELFRGVDELYESIMKKANGIYAEAGYKTVILDGMMAGMLSHEAVGHTVEADLVRGGSVAGPNLNKQVASELVTLVDYAHTAFGETAPLPVYLDDEGTEAQDAVIIKDGMLTGYMHNRETAQLYGVAPTGNARAWSFSDEPLIRMRNTAITPGNSTVQEIIESIDDGYYLVSSSNGQADLTGEFMFGVSEGYEIKNGKLGRALLDTTVSGVAFDMLKTVDMIGNQVTWSSSGFCGKKQMMPVGMGGPAIRCKITIGGR